jgi:glycosyltransferase involved in cell wall biosynthesis
MFEKSISVFLPALNEQENIKTCVLGVKKYLSKRFKDYEILVVSSGSTDNTENIIKELAKKDKHIKSLHQKKVGYGRALRLGFANVSKDLVFYTDGDNQFNIEDMDKLLPMLQKYDIISGYRLKRQDPLTRIVVADVYNVLIKGLFGLKVRDIDASFKLFKKDVFKKMNLKSNTGLIDAEVLIKAAKNGFSIGQVAVTHYPRVKGQTTYEMGNRNNIIAIVRPKVVIDILKEIKVLWKELK